MLQDIANWATIIGLPILVITSFWGPKSLIDFRKKHQELFWVVAITLFLYILYYQTSFIDFIAYRWSLPIWVFAIAVYLFTRIIIASISSSESNDSSNSWKFHFNYLGARWNGDIYSGFHSYPICLTDDIEMPTAFSNRMGVMVYRCPDCGKEIKRDGDDGNSMFEEVRMRYNQSLNKAMKK